MLSRYYSYSQFETYFQSILDALNGSTIKNLEIGKSVLGRSVYGLKIGSGSIKVLAWSQMHGNESTTTRALCHLLQRNDLMSLLKNIELYIIPVLNPDGAENWTRVNSNNVDLNRDSIDLSQPESVILRNVFENFAPDYCFNLHGQRSIYGSEDGTLPAQLSFLAPAGDQLKMITKARLRSMQVINSINDGLTHKISGIVGRYNDDFNINCVGDYMVSRDVPTILFEAGHAGDDYSRDQVTFLLVDALKEALNCLSEPAALDNVIIDKYEAIPQMSKAYVDILIKNYKSITGNQSLSIQFHELIKDGQLYFTPILIGINKEEVTNAHRVIDLAINKEYKDDLIVEGNLEIHSKSLGIKIFC